MLKTTMFDDNNLVNISEGKALYILSHGGFIHYIGCADNLRSQLICYQKQGFDFNKFAVLHWLPGIYNERLINHLKGWLRPDSKQTSIYIILDALPLFVAQFYRDLALRRVDDISDDDDDSDLTIFREVTGYWRIVAACDPTPANKQSLKNWVYTSSIVRQLVSQSP